MTISATKIGQLNIIKRLTENDPQAKDEILSLCLTLLKITNAMEGLEEQSTEQKKQRFNEVRRYNRALKGLKKEKETLENEIQKIESDLEGIREKADNTPQWLEALLVTDSLDQEHVKAIWGNDPVTEDILNENPYGIAEHYKALYLKQEITLTKELLRRYERLKKIKKKLAPPNPVDLNEARQRIKEIITDIYHIARKKTENTDSAIFTNIARLLTSIGLQTSRKTKYTRQSVEKAIIPRP